jgi:hypothetical protein
MYGSKRPSPPKPMSRAAAERRQAEMRRRKRQNDAAAKPKMTAVKKALAKRRSGM